MSEICILFCTVSKTVSKICILLCTVSKICILFFTISKICISYFITGFCVKLLLIRSFFENWIRLLYCLGKISILFLIQDFVKFKNQHYKTSTIWYVRSSTIGRIYFEALCQCCLTLHLELVYGDVTSHGQTSVNASSDAQLKFSTVACPVVYLA